MAIFPLAPDQTIAQMWSNGVRGGGGAQLDSSVVVKDLRLKDEDKDFPQGQQHCCETVR